MGELRAYYTQLTHDRQAAPRDDLASLIANSEVSDDRITDFSATAYFVILATAGHDTTAASISGAMEALARQPELFRHVRDDPSLIPALVEEAIRFTTPVKTFMLTAVADAEVAGRPIAAGDWLMLYYASGNRDEAAFEEPDSFRIDRRIKQQAAFGSGAHVCLGQHLARLEIRLLYEEMLPRLAEVALGGEPVMAKSSSGNG